MIYLIGGAPRVGKSLMAKKLAEETKSHFISTDDVCGEFVSGLSEGQRTQQFPMPNFSGEASHNTMQPKERVDLLIVSAKSLEQELDRIIGDAIQKQETIVLEGIHLLPSHVRGLEEKFGTENVFAIFVGSSDLDLVVDGIYKNTNPHNWLKDSDEAVIRQVAEFVAEFSLRIKKEAEENSITFIVRTNDFESDVSRFMEMCRIS
ncbi:MAG: hypothetical protein AAB664_01865 [Patescibacteria group bacterium]